MTTLTINIPDKEKNLITQMIKKLGGEVVSVGEKKTSSRESALLKLEKGLTEIKAIKEGKAKGLSLDDVFKK